MLLTIDVGNTQTVVGLYDHPRTRGVDAADGLIDHWRLATNAERTADESLRSSSPSPIFGPTAWMTQLAGSSPAVPAATPRVAPA